MGFTYEKIPVSDYFRFNDLREYRREFICKEKRIWSIDRERDLFVIFCIEREEPHRPDLDERTPSYYLLCNKGEFFGIEFFHEYIEDNSDKPTIVNCIPRDAILYLDVTLQGQDAYYYGLTQEYIEHYETSKFLRSEQLMGRGDRPNRFTIKIIPKQVRYLSHNERRALNLW